MSSTGLDGCDAIHLPMANSLFGSEGAPLRARAGTEIGAGSGGGGLCKRKRIQRTPKGETQKESLKIQNRGKKPRVPKVPTCVAGIWELLPQTPARNQHPCHFVSVIQEAAQTRHV